MAFAAGAFVWLSRGRGETVRRAEEGREEGVGGSGALGEVVNQTNPPQNSTKTRGP